MEKISSRPVLFISHDASRTGAPILLLRLLSYIKQNELLPFATVVKRNGPLIKSFAELGETLVLPSRFEPKYRGGGIFSSIGNRVSYRIESRRFAHNLNRLSNNAELVFLNSIASVQILHYLPSFTGKLVSYIHELEFGIAYHTTASDLAMLTKRTDLFLVPCATVGNNLSQHFNVPESKIKVLNYLIDHPNQLPEDKKKMHGATPDKFIVCGCGTTDWRKGFDLFYQVAWHLYKKRKKKDFHFIWIGGDPGSAPVLQAKIEMDKMGITDLVSLLPESDGVQKFMASADLFFLPSREDPYPLVVLEAAALQIPSICFDKGGGIVEFIQDDAGWISPFMEIDIVTDRIDYLIDNRSEVLEKGKTAAKKLIDRHSKEMVKDQLQDIFHFLFQS